MMKKLLFVCLLLSGCCRTSPEVVVPAYIPLVEYSASQNESLAAIMESTPAVIPYIRDYADLRSAVRVNNGQYVSHNTQK